MDEVDSNLLENYRLSTFYSHAGSPLQNIEQALQYVEVRRFVFLWPVKGIDLPSLWSATAGNRPVVSEHDDPGHVTWGWKDSMLDKRQWYYGKLLRGKATFVSLKTIAYFYALSDRVGDLDDYALAYDDGNLTWEEKSIGDALLKHGALNTIELRRQSKLAVRGAKSRFDSALASMQRGLWVIPIGISEAGAWKYAFRYELFDRWLPDVVKLARSISIADATKELTSHYLDSVGAADIKGIAKLFRWKSVHVQGALSRLADEKRASILKDGRWVTSKLEAMKI